MAYLQNVHRIEYAKLNERKKFYPEFEYSYLVGSPVDQTSSNYMRKLIIDYETIQRLGLNCDGLGTIEEYEDEFCEKKMVFSVNLYHPMWCEIFCGTDQDYGSHTVHLYITNFDDNSSITKRSTQINEIGNGVCPITLSVFCTFFEMFDFSNSANQNLIDRIYKDDSDSEYRFTLADFALPDVKTFIDYVETFNENNENNSDNHYNYKNAQLMLSLELLCEFLDCKIMRVLARSKAFFYIDSTISYFNSLRDQPDKLMDMLNSDTDMSWVRDVDDVIAELLSQWSGSPSPKNKWEIKSKGYDDAGDYESYKEFKNWMKCKKELFIKYPKHFVW